MKNSRLKTSGRESVGLCLGGIVKAAVDSFFSGYVNNHLASVQNGVGQSEFDLLAATVIARLLLSDSIWSTVHTVKENVWFSVTCAKLICAVIISCLLTKHILFKTTPPFLSQLRMVFQKALNLH